MFRTSLEKLEKNILPHLDTIQEMGILNVTPDSISDGGKVSKREK